MRKSGIFIVLLILSLVFAIGATSGLITLPNQATIASTAGPLAVTPQTYIDQGKTYLQQHNILAARDQFKAAVLAAPSNQEANLLYAVTRVFAVVQDSQSVPVDGLTSVQQVLELAGASIQSFNIYGSTMTMPKRVANSTPRTGAVLDFLKTYAIPEVDGAIANLAVVTDPAFYSVIAPADVGKTFGNNITIDHADVLVVTALLNLVKSNMDLLMVYGLDVNLPDIQANPEQLMTYKQLFQDPGLLAVKDASYLTAAKTALSTFIDTYTAAVSAVQNRTDGATNHLFVVDVAVTNEPLHTSSNKLAKLQNILNEIKLSLSGPHTFDGNAPVNMRTIDLSKFFDGANPIDIRAKLANAGTKTIVPDPTLNGLFPQGITGYETFAAKYQQDILGVMFTGQETPMIDVDPKSSSLVPAGMRQYITVGNKGTASLHVTSLTLNGPDAQDFIFNKGTCGAAPTLAPGASCAVSYSVKTSATQGLKYASLQIASDDISSPNTTVNVFGYGMQQQGGIFFNGTVTDSAGVAVADATIELVGNSSVSATSDASGYFSINGLPASTTINLKISKTGFAPVYTSNLFLFNSIYDQAPVVLFTPAELLAVGVQADKGAVIAKILDTINYGAPLSGASVNAFSSLHPSAPYPVTYFDGTQFGGSATYSNGDVFVLNADDGDSVTVQINSDLSITTPIVPVHAGAVGEAVLYGSHVTKGNGAISVSPASKQFGGVPVGGISATQAITISNNGTGVLNMFFPYLMGDDLQFFFPPDLTNPCKSSTSKQPVQPLPTLFSSGFLTGIYPFPDFTLAPGESCNMVAAFNPSTTGIKSATYVINSDDPNLPVFNIPLTGQAGANKDFNGDGKPDILWRNTSTGEVGLWLMNGLVNTGYQAVGSAPLEWTIAGVGDFNGDGKTDILWHNTTTGVVAIWAMNGTVNTGYSEVGSAPLEWTIAGVDDFNGDGKPDILWRNTSTGEVGLWLMNGLVNTGFQSAGSAPLEWVIAGTGDFNGDGKPDILWRNTTTGVVAIWAMNGTVNTGYSEVGSAPLVWTIAGVGDYNGDGKPDILWRNTSTGAVAIWAMNGLVNTGYADVGIAPLVWTIAIH